MKTYIFRTTTTMKEYNSKHWWIDGNIIYDPWGGEPEKGAKYRLFESYYNPDRGEYTLSFIRTVSSIKNAENYVFKGKNL